MAPAVPPSAAAAPPLPEPTESSQCPFGGLQVLELSPPAGASRGSKGRRPRKEKPAGHRAHPPSPPQARSRTPGQRLPGRHHAGSGLHTGLTARDWVPWGLTPLWDVNSLPFPEWVCVSTLQVTLYPQILLLTFGTLILRGRRRGVERAVTSQALGDPEGVDKGRTPAYLSPQTPGQGLLLWRGPSPFENSGCSS